MLLALLRSASALNRHLVTRLRKATLRFKMENVNPKSINKRNFTIIVEGNIGSGKSTFLNSFGNLSDITIMPEPVHRWTNLGGKHNLLELIYKDPLRWNMAFQSYVQLTRLQMHTKKVPTTFKLMERSLYSARYCFVQNYINTNMMTDCERIICNEWLEFICATQDVSVDLVVYLRTNPEVALERIRTRNRNEEAAVPLEYLQALHVLHDDWLRGTSQFKLPAPVVVSTKNWTLTDPWKRCELISRATFYGT
ncbi:deoxynucleoside kinase-like isoform X2 [Varroa jacobsoni]|uniref:Deoxynucleoside kinase domain-containing protein n=1 Tax=Varroa destructor TaxID=109461 RepID=A0A7M7K3V1_VARDE|nr:deoxynucleoside kinase-like isoform X2 [Varroa destructor]XP_022704554.1 deoxynucleoside kinase-like isoform X2 [Varroa jacobsoni]